MQKINLQPFGLNETEEKIYIATLELGPSTVHAIAKKAGIKRTTAYFAIENMVEKGFLSQQITGKSRLLKAKSPEFLENIVQREKVVIALKEESVTKLIPQLKALVHELPNRSQVSYYEGKEGIWSIFDDILKEKSDPYWLGDFEAALRHFDFKELFDRFSKKRRQIGKTKSYVISSHHPLAEKLYSLEDTDFREVKILEDKMDLNSALVIYGSKIALISFEAPLNGTVIENKSIAEMMLFMYMAIWNTGR